MNIRSSVACALVALVSSQSASASVGSFANQVIWENYVSVKGYAVIEQDVGGRPQGHYASLSGSAGGIGWTATAKGGILAGPKMMATYLAGDEVSLSFSFSPGVRAVGGSMFSSLHKDGAAASLVEIFLADGSTFAGFTFPSRDFIGFASTTHDIVGLTISALQPGDGQMASPTIGSLYVGAVPAPGALAVLGLAGLGGRRRRR